MQIVTYNNKNCLSLKDKNGEVNGFTILLVADSGHGKGISSEAFAERWKRSTGGVVINLNDPKAEIEYGFAQFEPKASYHLTYFS